MKGLCGTGGGTSGRNVQQVGSPVLTSINVSQMHECIAMDMCNSHTCEVHNIISDTFIIRCC